jgi:hypothetical protein
VRCLAALVVGLLPFAALGVLLGHLLTADVIGPATGGVVSLLALVSGTWFPLAEDGFLQDIAQFLPSYWLVQASHVSLGPRMDSHRLDRDRRMDVCAGDPRTRRLPPRHRARLTCISAPATRGGESRRHSDVLRDRAHRLCGRVPLSS